MNNQIEEIKQKIDIVEYIGRHAKLKKVGRNYKGLCPFHQEKTPSFVVSPDRQIWRCFGTCNDGGDVISFLMKWENISFFEALKDLADVAGVTLENITRDDEQFNRVQKMYEINLVALKYFQYVLLNTEFGKKSLEYLFNRGLSEKIIKTFEVGYSPDSWDSLKRYLLKKNYTIQEIVETGLIIKKTNGGAYDRFRNRIIFPLRDARSNVVGFSGRILDGENKEAKYVNTPETEIYHKRNHLFGLHLTKDAIRKEDNAVIVEGEFDMISPYQFGLDYFVAIKGAALTEGQLNIIKRYTKRLTLALDMDAAGIEAMMRGVALAEKMDFEVYIAEFKSGKDPDEALQKDPIQFKKDIKSARPIYDVIIEAAQKKYPNSSSFHKKKIAEEVAPFIILISNPIVRSHYVRKIASILEVTEGSVLSLLNKRQSSNKSSFRPKTNIKKSAPKKEELLQRFILAYLLSLENPINIIESIKSKLNNPLFIIPSYQKLFVNLESDLKIHQDFIYNIFISRLPAELQAVADELYMYSSDMPEFKEKEIVKMAYDLKRLILKKSIEKLLNSDDKNDEEKTSFLVKELNDVEIIYRTL
ncbi:DNA primase [Candidatus Roizmanbacteria bacterium CG11_big_fil_rev_8_21_14_0_20_36_8]|uniref:DNA primase n=2 Tax=Candidatus Roizmaniibacteriota TaxID=1752723 RepID=A0A2M6ITF9_9BACT|nr:MAG: DNA primase [Candidatus Roizmanbacteria bacterium CG11_big_fil_rev_8_21_14_0_20_36_8]PIZ64783.1 MAG: DNA primase [Candidatus Roizmanbacteria bacterium CG_4_10_14_0_2_um_filter_36_9]